MLMWLITHVTHVFAGWHVSCLVVVLHGLFSNRVTSSNIMIWINWAISAK